MYVQPISNSSNIAMHGRWDRIKQELFDKIPDVTFKNPSEKIERITDYISRPGPNRAIMGGTALIMQPPIDASNKKVDEHTRKLSVCRTVAKIIIGTLVGVAVRSSSYNVIKKMTQVNGTGKFSKTLLPIDFMDDFIKKEDFLNNYRSALSTLTALLVMVVTNFLIDAPLTALLTNKLQEKVLAKESENMLNEKKKEAAHA